LIQASASPLALGEIAQQLALPKSAVHRLLQVWLEREYVEQLPSGCYTPTLKLAIIGFGHLAATGIRDVCYPDLRQLAIQTGELARIAVEDHGVLTWIVEAQGARDGLRYDGNLGRQVLLHATASGKAWLATLPEKTAIALVRKQGIRTTQATGPNAVKSIKALLPMLREARVCGYATAIEEAAVGVNSVATALYAGSHSDRAVGTIIVVGPNARMTSDRIKQIVPELKAAAARISALWPIRHHTVTEVEADPE